MTQERHGLGDREQQRRADGHPLVEEPPADHVEQPGRGQHFHQADGPGGGQAADVVGRGAQHRVEHRRPGEVRRIIEGQRNVVEQVQDFQPPGVQVLRLVFERRVVQPERQHRLHQQDGQQHRTADPLPALARAVGLLGPGRVGHRQRHRLRRHDRGQLVIDLGRRARAYRAGGAGSGLLPGRRLRGGRCGLPGLELRQHHRVGPGNDLRLLIGCRHSGLTPRPLTGRLALSRSRRRCLLGRRGLLGGRRLLGRTSRRCAVGRGRVPVRCGRVILGQHAGHRPHGRGVRGGRLRWPGRPGDRISLGRFGWPGRGRRVGGLIAGPATRRQNPGECPGWPVPAGWGNEGLRDRRCLRRHGPRPWPAGQQLPRRRHDGHACGGRVSRNAPGPNGAGLDGGGLSWRAGLNGPGLNGPGLNGGGLNGGGLSRPAGLHQFGPNRRGFDAARPHRARLKRGGFNRVGLNRGGFDRAVLCRICLNRGAVGRLHDGRLHDGRLYDRGCRRILGRRGRLDRREHAVRDEAIENGPGQRLLAAESRTGPSWPVRRR